MTVEEGALLGTADLRLLVLHPDENFIGCIEGATPLPFGNPCRGRAAAPISVDGTSCASNLLVLTFGPFVITNDAGYHAITLHLTALGSREARPAICHVERLDRDGGSAVALANQVNHALDRIT